MLSEFPFFLDDVLFASRPRLAKLENIQTDFGDTSGVFINSIACLQECAEDIEQQSELQVAFEQWRRFLSVAYGKFDDSPTMFLVDTYYLSVFAKSIAYSVVTKKPIGDDATIMSILNGSVFERLNIERFVEDDFFHWVGAERYFKRLRIMFQEMNGQLTNYDFSDVREDILKGLYQELIDLETRHALWEYYTPDWLCERAVAEFKVKETSSFLDPACGSGSFLRAAIARMKREFPTLGAEALSEKVVGIYIQPLSVLIAKTTVLLSLGAAVSEAQRPVTLHVYLANSLLVPRGTADLFKKIAQVEGRNSIWMFILQNSYKPVFLMGRFDYVVGNPPSLTYASITNNEYQGLLLKLSDGYGVTPRSRANMPHLEIAAIFLAHSVNYFLKPSGQLAFVLPRSFMSADQHDNTRGGLVEGVRLSHVWDLDGVSVLFASLAACCSQSRHRPPSHSARYHPTASLGWHCRGASLGSRSIGPKLPGGSPLSSADGTTRAFKAPSAQFSAAFTPASHMRAGSQSRAWWRMIRDAAVKFLVPGNTCCSSAPVWSDPLKVVQIC